MKNKWIEGQPTASDLPFTIESGDRFIVCIAIVERSGLVPLYQFVGYNGARGWKFDRFKRGLPIDDKGNVDLKWLVSELEDIHLGGGDDTHLGDLLRALEYIDKR